MEWIGIFVLIDPLLISFFEFLSPISAGSNVDPLFFLSTCLLFILLLVMKLVNLYQDKIQIFHLLCFSRLRSQRTMRHEVAPNEFSVVALLQSLRQLQKTPPGHFLDLALNRSESDSEHGGSVVHQHLEDKLWWFNSKHLENRKEISYPLYNLWLHSVGSLTWSVGTRLP